MVAFYEITTPFWHWLENWGFACVIVMIGIVAIIHIVETEE